MSLLCLLGRHRPMLTSIIQRHRGFSALCDHCGAPIERSEGGRWTHVPAVLSKTDQAA
jgi:hypothetical protein